MQRGDDAPDRGIDNNLPSAGLIAELATTRCFEIIDLKVKGAVLSEPAALTAVL